MKGGSRSVGGRRHLLPLSNFVLSLARLLSEEKRLREGFHLAADSLREKFAV